MNKTIEVIRYNPLKEFNKDPQRYINLALNSDKRIQLLMVLFISDNITAKQHIAKILYIQNQMNLIKNSDTLYKMFSSEIITDIKSVLLSSNITELEEFKSKYSLNEEECTIRKLDKEYPYDKNGEVKQNFTIDIIPDKTISQFIEDNTIDKIREKRLKSLGL